MGMQYDVFASAPLTSSGQFENAAGTDTLARLRIKTIYGTCGGSAGTVMFYDGTDNSAPLLMTMEVPDDTAQGTYWLPMPGEGILAANGVYAEIVNAASVMIIYG
jgi:hypothetical protein